MAGRHQPAWAGEPCRGARSLARRLAALVGLLTLGWGAVFAAPLLPLPAGVEFPTRALFQAGDDPRWSEPEWDDTAWRSVSLDRSWHRQDAGVPWRVGQRGWYRLWFTLPPDLTAQSWTVSAGFVGNVSELWLNGRKVGGIGSFGVPEATGQRFVHAAVVPAAALRSGTNLLAVRVLNVAGEGGILGGPVGVFDAAEFLPVWKSLELGREVTRLSLAALCLGWAAVPLLFRLVGDRSRVFAGAGLPAALIGGSVLLHSQTLNSAALGPARPGLALLAWLIAGLLPAAIYRFCANLGRPSRLWAAWLAVGTVGFFVASAFHLRDIPGFMRVYAAFVLWSQAAFTAQCLSAPPARRLVSAATLAGTVSLTLGALAISALSHWPLVPFAAQWWDFTDAAILIFLGLMGGALLRGHVLAQRQETELGRRLVSAHSEERRQLGRQLHDGVLQDVQYWRLQTARVAESGETERAKTLEAVSAGLAAAARDLRQFAEDLQPVERREQGLAGALAELAARLQQRHAVAVATSVQLRADVPPAVQEILYRLAQEAAGNACRHSGASRVEVAIRDDGAAVVLEVIDAGVGFDPAQVPAGHLGLRFLRDHAEWIGGQLAVQSAAGHGTTIRATVPRPFRVA